mgnify:CR=1 FL=1
MLRRKIEDQIREFFTNESRALLVTGARQVGKTYIIRKVARECFDNVVEINFIEQPNAISLFSGHNGAKDLLMRLSAFVHKPLIPGKTLIFFDEIQECEEITTAIKFLVDDGSYRYAMSGSLLGVELQDVRSVPVGYLDEYEMFPLDLMEFFEAIGISRNIIDSLRECFDARKEVDPFVHNRMLEAVQLYLIVGGMPAAVQRYVDTNNLRDVLNIHRSIIRTYKRDITKHDSEHKLRIQEIYDLVPSELNVANKRFILKELHAKARYARYDSGFMWLKDAGTAIPAFCVDEPQVPLFASGSRNLFKLFMCDIGLLMRMYGTTLPAKILAGSLNMNYGALYENIAAQELTAHGYDLYYYNSHKNGELDFLIERDDGVIPIEVKSGKDYRRHNALTNVMNNPRYDIKEGVVLCNDNVSTEGKVSYLPAYMLMYIIKEQAMEDYIYKPNMEGIN